MEKMEVKDYFERFQPILKLFFEGLIDEISYPLIDFLVLN